MLAQIALTFQKLLRHPYICQNFYFSFISNNIILIHLVTKFSMLFEKGLSSTASEILFCDDFS
jgi:hypothetical protein